MDDVGAPAERPAKRPTEQGRHGRTARAVLTTEPHRARPWSSRLASSQPSCEGVTGAPPVAHVAAHSWPSHPSTVGGHATGEDRRVARAPHSPSRPSRTSTSRGRRPWGKASTSRGCGARGRAQAAAGPGVPPAAPSRGPRRGGPSSGASPRPVARPLSGGASGRPSGPRQDPSRPSPGGARPTPRRSPAGTVPCRAAGGRGRVGGCGQPSRPPHSRGPRQRWRGEVAGDPDRDRVAGDPPALPLMKLDIQLWFAVQKHINLLSNKLMLVIVPPFPSVHGGAAVNRGRLEVAGNPPLLPLRR